MRASMALAGLLILSACNEKAPDPDAVEDDVQEVREMHDNPPPTPIDPDRITYADIEKHGLFGAGCGFAKGGGLSVIMQAQPERAFMIVDGRLIEFAADKGSESLPLSTWSQYDSSAYALEIERNSREVSETGIERITWPATLTVLDAKGRQVFASEGSLQCGS